MKLVLISLALVFTAFNTNAQDFPLRTKFPGVPVVEMQELAANYDKHLIVDVRTKSEFDVIHIAKAVLIPSSTMSFLPQLEKLRSKDNATTLVFYCNGVKCDKSFEAAKAATKAGFKNIKVLDAGIFAWCKAHPQHTTLLGKTPADLSKIISEENYKARLLSFDQIKSAASDANTVIVDVRDLNQKKKDIPLKSVRSIPLDRLNTLFQDPELKKKNLIFIDAVGQQNEWLQYHLIDNGFTNFKFLQGGADSI